MIIRRKESIEYVFFKILFFSYVSYNKEFIILILLFIVKFKKNTIFIVFYIMNDYSLYKIYI